MRSVIVSFFVFDTGAGEWSEVGSLAGGSGGSIGGAVSNAAARGRWTREEIEKVQARPVNFEFRRAFAYCESLSNPDT